MPLQVRTTTLSTAVTASGIRCYTKTADGEVREARHEATDAELVAAIESGNLDVAKQDKDWLPGLLRFHCSPNSSLCALAWGQNEQAIFYQAEDYTLRLKRRGPQGWVDTDFEQKDVLPGTNLAEMHSANGNRLVVIYQSADGWVYYRCADNWKWDTAAIRICEAAPCTGIAATSWNDLASARLYFQDDKYVIREYLGSFSKEWRPVDGFELKYKTAVGDITAISWEDGDVNVRLYLQDDDDAIIEWINEGKGWKKGAFTAASLPEADITAYVRNASSSTARCINVMWTGQDQMLYQRVRPLAHNAWLEPTAIASLTGSDTSVGRWAGAHFSDNHPGIDERRITKVVTSVETALCGLQLEYDDGSSSAWHGGQTGDRKEFVVRAGEEITRVLVAADDESVQGVQFVTSKGVASPWFGTECAEPIVWEYRGHALAGFMGTSDAHINGLKPFWSTRIPTATDLTLDETARLVERIGADIDASQIRIDGLRKRSVAYEHEAQEALRSPADAAVGAVARFVAGVEYLHELNVLDSAARDAGKPALPGRAEDIATNVKRCQDEAAAVAALFKVLAGAAAKLVPEGEKIDQGTAKEKDSAEVRERALADVQKAAMSFKLEAVKKQKSLEAERANIEAKLRAAEQESEKHLKDLVQKQSRKDFWDKRTLGLNNWLDPFGMKHGIDKTSKSLASARTAAAIASANYFAAGEAVALVDAELKRIEQLAAAAQAHHSSLDAVVGAMGGLVAQTRALAQTAADLQVLMEKMHAEAEELDDQHTAETFARELLDIVKLAQGSKFLSAVMRDRAVEFETTVSRILGTQMDHAVVA